MKLRGKVKREAVSWKVRNVPGRRNAMYKETRVTAKGREYGTFSKLDVESCDATGVKKVMENVK